MDLVSQLRHVSPIQAPTRPNVAPLQCHALGGSRLCSAAMHAALPSHSPCSLPSLAPRGHVCRHQQKRNQQRAPVTVPQAAFSPALLASSSPALVDAAWFVVAGLGAKVWTKLFDLLVSNGVLEQKLSRKLVHITTGPIFLLTWPLFSLNPWARVWAAAVPALNAVRLLTVGLGAAEDKGLVASVSRSGDRGELLKGPLYYTLVLMATTLFCWRDDPIGMVVVCLMCGGDGFADIIGRRWGAGNKLFFNPTKSWAGSLGMLLGGTAMAAGLVTFFCQLGYFQCYSPSVLLPYLLAVSGVATVVESLPINQVLDDNLTVPLVSAIAAMVIMPYAAAAAATSMLVAL